jgi:hypothetical protein
MYLSQAKRCLCAAGQSDYTYMKIYYRSIRERSEDLLSSSSYVWRWDTDWFWCSKHFYLQTPVVRAMAGWALGSKNYHRLMLLSHRLVPDSGKTESVVQDADIPIERAAEFLEFLLSRIGITPIWICPFRSFEEDRTFDLCPFDPGRLYINFGFWDVLPRRGDLGCINREVERKAQELGGVKALYSTAYYDSDTFWSIFNKARYVELRHKYEADRVFPDLYSKCVLRH